MAKQNVIHLMGIVEEFLMEDKSKFKLKIRKNENKFVYPIIQLTSTTAHLKEKISIGKTVLIQGKLTTTKKINNFYCSNCGELIDNHFIETTVTAFDGCLLAIAHDEAYLNNAIIIGSVCKEIQFKYIPGKTSPVAKTSYQIASNRTSDEADYPFINTYTRQAEEDLQRLQLSSQVLVNGTLVTRTINKQCKCLSCSSTNIIDEFVTEINGGKVEYLNNCLF